jgi:hypothetical protein
MQRYVLLVATGLVAAATLACQPGAAGLNDQDAADNSTITSSKRDGSETGLGHGLAAAYYAEDAQWMMANVPRQRGARQSRPPSCSGHPSRTSR